MRIEFFDKQSNEIILNGWYYVDRDGDVFRDTEETAESQYETVGLDTFLEVCKDVGWRVVREEEE
jgi:hypothetical protein